MIKEGVAAFVGVFLLLLVLLTLPWIFGYLGVYLNFVWCHFHPESYQC
jgi:hypothetical protein